MAANRVALALQPRLEEVFLATILPPHLADLGREALDPLVQVPLGPSAPTPLQTPILSEQNQPLVLELLLPLLAQVLVAPGVALVRQQQPLLLEVELALVLPSMARRQPQMEQPARRSIQ